MRVQLITPPVYLNVHALTALRPSFPLGLAYIAAVLERDGHDVRVIDAVAEAPDRISPDGRLHRLGLSPGEIVERIRPDAEAIGITNMWSFSWPLVRTICREIKQRFPEVPLVAGGEHFTGLPELSLREAPVDWIVLGEGEETAVELFRVLGAGNGRAPEAIEGVAFCRGGEVVRNPRRARIRDVDALPWPAWEHFDLQAYNEHRLVLGVAKGFTVPILATRGCPYQCTYCSSAGMWTPRWHPRDPIDVVDEIQSYAERYGARNFPFQDLTAIVKRDWTVTFAREILRRGLDITWQFPSGTRCEVIDDEVADLLYRSGGRHLAYAPESGSEATRKRVKKRMKTESLLRAVEASVRHRLNITVFLVVGFPDDTWADLKESVRLARQLARLGIDDVATGFYFPIPNTEIYRELLAEGRIRLDDDFLMTPIFANDEKCRPENCYSRHLSPRELTRAKYRILLHFYGASLLYHPGKFLRILQHVIQGKEERKLETWLLELKRKGGIWVRDRLPGRRRGTAGARAASAASRGPAPHARDGGSGRAVRPAAPSSTRPGAPARREG